MYIGVVRGTHTGTRWIIGTRPTLLPIMQVAQHVKVLLPAGWESVKRLARGQFHTRGYKMQFVVPCVAMPYPQNVVLIRLQPCKGGAFKIIHQAAFLLWSYGVLWPP